MSNKVVYNSWNNKWNIEQSARCVSNLYKPVDLRKYTLRFLRPNPDQSKSDPSYEFIGEVILKINLVYLSLSLLALYFGISSTLLIYDSKYIFGIYIYIYIYIIVPWISKFQGTHYNN
jgi:hypothetical protein